MDRLPIVAMMVVWLTVLSGTLLFAQSDNVEPATAPAGKQPFELADDIVFERVLAEPVVRQPLFLDFDERGRLWVVQYIQYPYPAGLKPLSHDKHWRMVFDKKPVAPPNHERGRDVISIHEDTNGDGQFDKHKTFVDGLSIATSFARGRGGVWVLNPPYLLFYPDVNNDDVPDSDPILHLSGFGIEDTHSCANSLRWGPDGWLYGCQGSTVSGHIVRAGFDDTPVYSMGQLVWRYHPETRRYEIFAEGGGNAFGLEFDSLGAVYSGHNGGNTRGFHYVQGGYFQKSFGKHGVLSNPFAFGYFSWMGHHNVPRFTHNFVIYEGHSLPSAYQGKILGIGPLQSHIIMAEVAPEGSTYKTTDIGVPVQGNDERFRPVDIKLGPDGAVYVADFAEKHISHRQHYDGQIEKDTGRVFRIAAKNSQPYPRFDMGKESSVALVELLRHPNKWHRQTALRVLADRHDASVVPALKKLIQEQPNRTALDGLWALNLSGGLTGDYAVQCMQHSFPQVRSWTVRLMADPEKPLEAPVLKAFVELALQDQNAHVLSQLASSALRLPATQSMLVIDALTTRQSVADDPHIPLLIWWALESKAGLHRKQILDWLKSEDVRDRKIVREHLLERIMRRFALAGKQRDLLTCAQLLENSRQKDADILLQGFEKAYKGRSLTGLPERLVVALEKSGGGSDALKLRRSDPVVLKKALSDIENEKLNPAARQQLIEILGEIKAADSIEPLLRIALESKPESVQVAAISSLQFFSDPSIGNRLIDGLNKLRGDALVAGQSLLASRPEWSRVWLQYLQSHPPEAKAVSPDVIWKLQLHSDAEIQSAVGKLWKNLSGSTSKQLQIRAQQLVTIIDKDAGDPYAGEKVFNTNCARCHRLYDYGAEVGPNLTSYKRDDLSRMLVNIVNPSAEIREGYETWLAVLEDGRTVTGFKTDEDDRLVVLRSADGSRVPIRKSEIDEMIRQPRSLMPEGLLKNLDDQQIRDLFAYLRTSQPLP